MTASMWLAGGSKLLRLLLPLLLFSALASSVSLFSPKNIRWSDKEREEPAKESRPVRMSFCLYENNRFCEREVQAALNVDVSLTCSVKRRVNFCLQGGIYDYVADTRTLANIQWFRNNLPIEAFLGNNSGIVLEQFNSSLTILAGDGTHGEHNSSYQCSVTSYRWPKKTSCDCSLPLESLLRSNCLIHQWNATGNFKVTRTSAPFEADIYQMPWIREAIYFRTNESKPVPASITAPPGVPVHLLHYYTDPEYEKKYGLGVTLTLDQNSSHSFECPVLAGSLPLESIAWYYTDGDTLDSHAFLHTRSNSPKYFENVLGKFEVHRWSLRVIGLKNKWTKHGIHCQVDNGVYSPVYTYLNTVFSWLIDMPRNSSETLMWSADAKPAAVVVLDNKTLGVGAEYCMGLRMLDKWDDFSHGRWMVDVVHIDLPYRVNLSQLIQSDAAARRTVMSATVLDLVKRGEDFCLPEGSLIPPGWILWSAQRLRRNATNSSTVALQWVVPVLTDSISNDNEWNMTNQLTKRKDESDGMSRAQRLQYVIVSVVSICTLAVLVVAAFVPIWCLRRKRRVDISSTRVMDINLDENPNYGRSTVTDGWKLDGARLELGVVVGEGEFGVVYRALLWLPDDVSIVVAVKTARDARCSRQQQMLQSELDVLKAIGPEPHPNVLSLIGFCHIYGSLHVVTAFADCGSLLSILERMRSELETGSSSSSFSSSSSVVHGVGNLLHFVHQVAAGIAYLASKNIIHSDLAARNVLAASNPLTLKIADFGLTRLLNDSEYYQRRTEGVLPIKWLAPEALIERRCTTKSDVWSFGVLMWEVFSLGSKPYPDYPLPETYDILMARLRNGCRMARPRNMPPDLYKLVLQCWEFGPCRRPPMSAVRERILVVAESTDDIPLMLPGPSRREGKLVPVLRESWLRLGSPRMPDHAPQVREIAPEAVSPHQVIVPRGVSPLSTNYGPLSGLNTTGDSLQPLLPWGFSAASTPAPRFYINQLSWGDSVLSEGERGGVDVEREGEDWRGGIEGGGEGERGGVEGGERQTQRGVEGVRNEVGEREVINDVRGAVSPCVSSTSEALTETTYLEHSFAFGF